VLMCVVDMLMCVVDMLMCVIEGQIGWNDVGE